ncbi:MAG: HIT family protein, partial [Firmicutes bacterium]|nr:HIT family protein [Bacillota bacterium]
EVDYFFDMAPDLLSQILLFAQPVASALKQVTGADRIALMVAGFDVPHAHLHLVPASGMQDLDFSHVKMDAPIDTVALQQMAERIHAVLPWPAQE